MYEELIKVVPKLKAKLLDFASHPDQLEPFITMVSIICMLRSQFTNTQSVLHTCSFSAARRYREPQAGNYPVPHASSLEGDGQPADYKKRREEQAWF